MATQQYGSLTVSFGPPLSRRPLASDFYGFSDCERVFQFDAEISHRAVHLGVTEQQLHGAEIAGLAVDLRDLGPAHRMGAIGCRLQPYRCDPIADQPGILTGRDVQPLVEAARPQMFRSDHQRVIEPGRNRFARSLGDLEANRFPGLALDDRGPLLDLAGRVNISNLEPHEITAPQFAVDGEVEQRQVADIGGDFEPDPDRPDMLWQQRSLLADDAALVPGRAAGA